MIKITLLHIVLVLSLILMTAVPVIAGPIKDIDITLADDRAGATTDYEISFTPKTGEATAVSIDFSAFGLTGTDMILSAVSTNISDYSFSGFSVNPSGVIVNDATKIITFTGGTTTKDTEHTVINTISGTGLVITNDQDAETRKVDFSTASDSGSSWLAINPGPIDHYSVSNVSSPPVAGTVFGVTIQAQDQYNNDITSGAGAAETANITFTLADAGATPTSTITKNGKATVDITMTIAQTGQSIIFTGDTSKKIGISNAFTVLKPSMVNTNDASNIGVNSARLNGNLDDLGTAASVDISFEWWETSDGLHLNETTPQTVNTTGAFSFDLSSLTPNTTYYFRAKAAGDGTSYGTEKSFTTLTPEYGGDDNEPYDYYLEINVLGVKKRFYFTSTGKVLETIDFMSSDAVLNIHINKGTVVHDKHGRRLRTLDIATVGTLFAPPDGTYILGQAYSFLPPDTTFNPSMTLTWCYLSNALQEGAQEEDLFLAWYDKNAGTWVKLDCMVDVVNHTIIAEVDHSTIFAALGFETKSVAFTVNNLIISPSKVNPGEIVNIGVSVVNSGDLTGIYKVILKINDAVVNVKEVVVPAHTTRDIVLELSRDTIGTYSVDVNGLAGSFIVERVVSNPIQPSTPTQPPVPPNPPAPKSSNWLLIVSIAVVLVIVGPASYWFAMKRPKS